ncbi:MAG: ATP-binding cassette domain-containing protein [Anaerolineae bacterium]|nr:ATP-binding cassette domain-containing protein [Anaerolineae bacterium]
MISVRNVSKSYGEVQALKGIDFEVAEGEIVGLLGPNGAGKSTTIKILTGYFHPDSGSVEIDGRDVITQTKAVQADIGYLPETTPLYPNLSVQAYLKLVADMRNLPPEERPALISEALVATGLVDHRARLISHLSKGLRQRVGLAQAILHKPKLLILDEPTIGLDPTQIVEIRNLIKRLAEHSTILFSSHILSEVEAVCDRVIIIMNGEVKTDDRLVDLAATTDAVLILQTETEGVQDLLLTIDQIETVERFESRDGYPAYRVCGASDVTPVIYDLARQENWPVRELRQETMTLEAIFNRLATAA